MKTIGRKLKAIYLMAVIALVSICMSFIPFMANTVKADEATATAGLRVTGAQVKVLDDGSQFAVYFHTEITEDFYNALGEGSKQLGMIVGPKTMINRFSDFNAVAVDTFNTEVGAVVTDGNLTNVNKAANFKFVGMGLEEPEFKDGIYTFEAGVVFDEAELLQYPSEDALKLAAATELTAVPYYVVDEAVTMNKADAVTRTAKDVLIETKVRMNAGESDAEISDEIIAEYVGNVDFDAREFYMDNSGVYAPNANKELVVYRGHDLDMNFESMSIAGVPFDMTNPGNSYANIADGSVFSEAYTYADGSVKVLSIKKVTKVLSTVKDFFNDADGSGVVEDAEMIQANYIFDLKVVAATGARNPQVAIKGYYVLANNIDLQNKSVLTASGLGDQSVQIFDGSQDVGFRATLDGRGFALQNGNPGDSSGGMFGAFYGATIKNIAFDGFQSTRNDGAVLILGYVYRSTFENVYIRVIGNAYGDNWLSSNGGLTTFGISDAHGGSTFTNVVFENTVGLEANKANDHYRAIFTGSTAGMFENTTIIGMPVTFRFDKHATDTEKYVLSLTFPQDAMASFGVEAGQVALEEVPEAVTNAYGNFI
ncbi:MAG: hypothetical protein J6V71_00215, partial [Clostridia bacterium]|nr:hypothetical protein [Clostridia bacterium]